MRLLLDEMYPAALAVALRAAGVDARTVVELGLAGRSDPEILAAAVTNGYAVLTENVADFAHISAEHLSAGQHHPGVLIGLSSRFSRRRAGIGAIVASAHAVVDQRLEDRVVYLQNTDNS